MTIKITYKQQVEMDHRRVQERRQKERERTLRRLDIARVEIDALRLAGYPNPIRAWSLGIRA